MSQKLLRLQDVIEKTRIGRASIYVRMGRGEFPRPMKLSRRTAVWPEDLIDEWIAERREEAYGQPEAEQCPSA